MTMDDLGILITRYWYVLAALVLGLVFIVLLVRTHVRWKDGQSGSRRGILDYLFLWPLLLSRRDGSQVVRRGFSSRELIGWLIVAVIAVLAVVLTRFLRG